MKVKDIIDLKGCYSVHDVGEKEIPVEKIPKLKHNCEEWFEEARGCAICAHLVYKTPIKTMKKFKYLIELHSAAVSELRLENADLKEKIRRHEKEKLKPSVEEIEKCIDEALIEAIHDNKNSIKMVAQAIYNLTPGYEKARLGDAVIDFKRTVKEVFINDITKIKNFFRRKNK